jgi:hypothetical protein
MVGAVYGVAKDAIDYVLSLITATSYGNTADDKQVVAAADFGQGDIGEIWGKADAKIKSSTTTLTAKLGKVTGVRVKYVSTERR